MKIGLVLYSSPKYSETFFLNKIKFLIDLGVEIKLFVDTKEKGFNLCPTVIGYARRENRILHFVEVLRVFIRLLINPRRSLRLWEMNKSDGFKINQNIVSLFQSAHLLSCNLDWLHFGFATTAVNRENVARLIGAQMAVSIRGYDINVYPLKNEGVYNLLWKRINKLHYLGNDLLSKAIDLGFDINVPNQKITPAIDINLFNTSNRTRKGSDGVITFTTVARLHWIKGLNYTLEALGILKQRGYVFSYNIIGDGAEYESLIFFREQLSLSSEVNFLGKLNSKSIVEELSNTDVYIQYSLEEGFCNAVLEAQAVGCLCVVSDSRGLKENVLENITGFVVEKRNPTMLADKLVEVMNLDEKTKIAIRKTAIKRVSDEFSLSNQKCSFRDFYLLKNV